MKWPILLGGGLALPLKEIARAGLISWVRKMPYGFRRALIRGLAEGGRDNGYGLAQFAKASGVSTIMAKGQSGLIQGSSLDEVLIPIYGRDKTWAPTTLAFFRDALKDGGTYIDIGANIGLTTISVAQNPNVRCIAFEPDPTNFSHLLENIGRNCPHDNVTLHRKAVMEKCAKAALGLNSEGNIGDHALVRAGSDRKTVEIDGVALDEFLPKIALPLAIKIDTQGAEPYVIAGAQKTLAKASAVMLEFWPYGMARMGSSPEAALDLIGQFDVVRVVKGDTDEGEIFDPKTAISVLRQRAQGAAHADGISWDVYLTR